MENSCYSVFYKVSVLKEIRTLPSLLQLYPVFSIFYLSFYWWFSLESYPAQNRKIQTKKRRRVSDQALVYEKKRLVHVLRDRIWEGKLQHVQCKGGRSHLKGAEWEMRHLKGITANQKWNSQSSGGAGEWQMVGHTGRRRGEQSLTMRTQALKATHTRIWTQGWVWKCVWWEEKGQVGFMSLAPEKTHSLIGSADHR